MEGTACTQPECAHSILEAQAANVGKLNLVLTSSHTTNSSGMPEA